MGEMVKSFGLELDTKEGLQKLYDTTPYKEIIKKHKINAQLLYRRLRRFNISLRPRLPNFLTKEWFEINYYKYKMSKTELTKKAGVSIATINRFFKEYDIKGRSFQEAGLLRSDVIRKRMKELWTDPAYAKNFSHPFDTVKEKMAHLAKEQLGKPSKIEVLLYSILDDLHIKYEPEKIFGYWTYDCFVPDYNLIIECQGEYWHGQEKAKINDQAKATYLERYFPHLRLKHIWEHEFHCKDRIIDLIKYWTGTKLAEAIDFSFTDVQIKEVEDEDAKRFIAKYHYFGRIGKNSTRYGAYLNDVLIAVCAFACVTRKESADRLGIKTKEIRELSRFCIHPSYQKKNFATWFISKCVKLLHIKFPILKSLISFADTSFNHNGTIYKAANWTFDGKVKPDYWYAGEGGYVMHKKTLWDQAMKMGLSEREYADSINHKRVFGKEKLRFIFNYPG